MHPIINRHFGILQRESNSLPCETINLWLQDRLDDLPLMAFTTHSQHLLATSPPLAGSKPVPLTPCFKHLLQVGSGVIARGFVGEGNFGFIAVQRGNFHETNLQVERWRCLGLAEAA